jgi:hypothetical protein
MDIDDPRLRKSNTDMDDPKRATLRRDSDDPKWRKSNTDIDEPKRA